jgi:hypothetical protein
MKESGLLAFKEVVLLETHLAQFGSELGDLVPFYEMASGWWPFECRKMGAVPFLYIFYSFTNLTLTID